MERDARRLYLSPRAAPLAPSAGKQTFRRVRHSAAGGYSPRLHFSTEASLCAVCPTSRRLWCPERPIPGRAVLARPVPGGAVPGRPVPGRPVPESGGGRASSSSGKARPNSRRNRELRFSLCRSDAVGWASNTPAQTIIATSNNARCLSAILWHLFVASKELFFLYGSITHVWI